MNVDRAVRVKHEYNQKRPCKHGEPAFCEATTAGGGSHWHIRILGLAGLKPSGGIDTSSLCGHVTPEKGGWGINVPFSSTHRNVCKKCLSVWADTQTESRKA